MVRRNDFDKRLVDIIIIFVLTWFLYNVFGIVKIALEGEAKAMLAFLMAYLLFKHSGQSLLKFIKM